MKHVKIMSMPECDKLIYSAGVIARQIGALFVVDDEHPQLAMSYPIVAGGRKLADGWLSPGEECMQTPVVCRVGEKISPRVFAKFVKMGMHEEVPASAYELYGQLCESGADLQLPVMASSKEPVREFHVELEINDFMKEEGFCYATDTADFYFEAYFEAGNHDAGRENNLPHSRLRLSGCGRPSELSPHRHHLLRHVRTQKIARSQRNEHPSDTCRFRR